MADGITAHAKLREFRDRFPLNSTSADLRAAAQLRRTSTDRLMLDARLDALAIHGAESHLNEMTSTITQPGLNPNDAIALLTLAWEADGEGPMEDGLFTLDEENSLDRCIDHFRLNHDHLNCNRPFTQAVKSAVLRDIAESAVTDL